MKKLNNYPTKRSIVLLMHNTATTHPQLSVGRLRQELGVLERMIPNIQSNAMVGLLPIVTGDDKDKKLTFKASI